MERLTNEQIESIRKRAEADNDFDIFGDVPKLLAEIDRLRTVIKTAEKDLWWGNATGACERVSEMLKEAIAND